LSELTARVEADVPLASCSTLGVGGPARWFVRAVRTDDVAAAHRWSIEQGIPLFVLGGGSNVVIADEGWNGLVLQVALGGVTMTESGDEMLVRAGAGEPWDGLVRDLVDRGLAGVECLSGIPGSVGGTPIQNVGAYGQEVGAVIADVTAWDRRQSALVTLPADACGFAYRLSRFKRDDAGRFVICAVTFRLRPGAPRAVYPDVVAQLRAADIATPTLADVRRAVLAVRRRKGMVLDPADPDTRSVGSFFVNPVVPEAERARIGSAAGSTVPAFALGGALVKIPAAWLIERSGLDRAQTQGGAAISSKHSLAIVNCGGATARDVLALAVRIKRRVMDRFGVSLRPEPVFVGFASDPDVAYLQE
jgi:UDP-N-acetylmuramate dehydrogenase